MGEKARTFRVRTARGIAASPVLGRAMVAGQVPRLLGMRNPTATAVARALTTLASGRTRADERQWLARIEARRRELASDGASMGARFEPGSGPAADWVANMNRPVPIWGVSRMCSIPPAWGRFQLHLVRALRPRSCLELGTALGMSAAYQAAALELNGFGSLTTLEGALAWAELAQQGIDGLGLGHRVDIRVGPIHDTLPEVCGRIAPVDYAFLDADHTEQATLEHFDMVLPHVSSGGVVVLDDITFSRAMWRAWNAITSRDRVSTSVALGRMGVVVAR